MLDDRRLLDRVIPTLAKKFGISREEIYNFLGDQNGFLDNLVSQRDDSKIRHGVNVWWDRFHKEFPKLNIGNLTEANSPSKVPQSTYDQLIVLAWLVDILESRPVAERRKIVQYPQFTQKEKATQIETPAKIEVAKLTLWQRIFRWFKNLLRGGGRNEKEKNLKDITDR